MLLPSLYPDLPALRSFMLPVGSGHLLNMRKPGRPDGLPALVLHGGPGSGCSPLLARFFGSQRYRVICPDQRDSGQTFLSRASDMASRNALPHSGLRWAEGAGRDPTHPAMVAALGSIAVQGSSEAAQVT